MKEIDFIKFVKNEKDCDEFILITLKRDADGERAHAEFKTTADYVITELLVHYASQEALRMMKHREEEKKGLETQ